MKCTACGRWSVSHICASCQQSLLTPSLSKRKLFGSIPVYSFYPYSEVEPLIVTKHTDLGYYIYSIMAKQSFRKFAEEWDYEYPAASIGIDDRPRGSFSHTALLNHALKSTSIKPYYGHLRSKNDYKYAGKTLEERIQNPRNFAYVPFNESEVILVDDIITTGTTLSEAVELLSFHGKKVILCLTLADADR